MTEKEKIINEYSQKVKEFLEKQSTKEKEIYEKNKGKGLDYSTREIKQLDKETVEKLYILADERNQKIKELEYGKRNNS